MGEVPTPCTPPIPVVPLPQPNPSCTPDIASKVARGRYDASFNFNFLRLAVHLLDDAVDLRKDRGNIVNDDCVGAFIGHHIATLTQEFLDRQQNVFGMRIAEEAGDADFVDRQSFGIDLGAAVFGFLPQRFNRGDTKYIAIQLAGKIVVLEDDVERLVPRHVIEHNRQVAVHHGVEHDIQTADLMDQAEEVFQIDILKID